MTTLLHYTTENTTENTTEKAVNLIVELSADPENVILVHSLYNNVLNSIRDNLNSQNIVCSKLVDDFSQSDWKILLFNHLLSAGYDLTKANHLIIIEPKISPTIESRITFKILRFTQKRAVTMHWILDGSGGSDIDIYYKCQKAKKRIKEVENIMKSIAFDF